MKTFKKINKRYKKRKLEERIAKYQGVFGSEIVNVTYGEKASEPTQTQLRNFDPPRDQTRKILQLMKGVSQPDPNLGYSIELLDDLSRYKTPGFPDPHLYSQFLREVDSVVIQGLEVIVTPVRAANNGRRPIVGYTIQQYQAGK